MPARAVPFVSLFLAAWLLPIVAALAGVPPPLPPAGLEAVPTTILAAPPFPGPDAGPPRGPSPLRLVPVSVKPNAIIDEERWLARNGLTLPVLSRDVLIAAGYPAAVSGRPLRFAVSCPHRFLIGYGDVLYGLDPQTGQPAYALDFTAWRGQHLARPKEAAYTAQELRYAWEDGDVLYVEHAHMTYAASSGRKNASVSALAVRDGRLLWRSAALTANAGNFVVLEDVLLTGYGFTQEPDFLFILDRATGQTLARQALKSGPDWLVLREGRLFVRTYNMDAVYRLER